MNNADLGMTLQKLVCEEYHLIPCPHAQEQFSSNFNREYVETIAPLIRKIFGELGAKPIECTTYKESNREGERFLPYNFVLDNGCTLSIRTSKNNHMVAPRVVGQAGFDVLNYFFGYLIEERFENQEQIRTVIYENIDEMLPLFVTYLLNSDYTVWLYPKNNSFEYIIINNNTAVDIEYKRSNFTFTRDLPEWKESTTLKYKNLSIAEIQTHKNRTFKFRFNLPNLITLFGQERITNETIGITAEYVICKMFNLDYPENFSNRISHSVANDIKPAIQEAFKHLPKAIKHTGSDSGERLGASKCSYDFVLEGGKTLSLKTNIGKMVCPPEVGQPGASTFYHYFKDLISESFVDELIFKNLVLNRVEKMLPIYIEHLFDSDYLLWIFNFSDKWDSKILEKGFGKDTSWLKEDLSFSKPTVGEWNESNTLKYKNKRIGEFQFHHHRNCYKFRFDLKNLIDEVLKAGTQED